MISFMENSDLSGISPTNHTILNLNINNPLASFPLRLR